MIARLDELLSLVPTYKDAAVRLERAKLAKQLTDLYQEARQLAQAGKWQAVVNVFSKISSLQPDYPDPDDLLQSAQREVAEIERLETMQDLYNRALREMDFWSMGECPGSSSAAPGDRGGLQRSEQAPGKN